MSLIKALMIVVILNLIGCASMPSNSPTYSSQNIVKSNDSTLVLIAPDIAYQPEKAFFPLRVDPSDNKIKPSYQNEVCIKKFLGICTKWEKRTLFFNEMEWFLSLGFGLYKMPDIK